MTQSKLNTEIVSIDPESLQRPEYIEDTKRIMIIALKHDILLTPPQAESVWLNYSESMAAGWMGMNHNTDDEIWMIIRDSIEK